MWPRALETEAARAVLDRAEPYEELTLRLFGIPESEIAKTLREVGAETDLSPLEITTCLRRAELHIDIRNRADGDEARERLIEGIRERHGRFLFSTTAPRSTSRSRRCCAGHTDRARRVVHRRPGRRAADRSAGRLGPTSPAAWSPTRTRRRASCSA